MAPSIFSSNRRNRNGTIEQIEETVEDQLENLRSEIAALASLVQKTGARKGRKLRAQTEAGLEDLWSSSEDLLGELRDGYLRGSHELKRTVRKHPLATVGAAAAFGLVLALLARR
ncbi:hypothetical protein MRS76_01920 [Rhizobiaceae bacterium n13]|uniref:ElaB/YqjD/DUF883 family membrane-anchored ribosome-binding protein n=1 Tax=Ferirhizobium litorale TaxID=2927786 RepID=A0AAE3QBJ6_9HYPH|nr:hypothetical protein [Fererhizobium litorale]MDI7860702.1 hypothetical protein [Fererhizobium litorale]MDI7920850.1 hypothetical protein [Fererhizobium litorale]